MNEERIKFVLLTALSGVKTYIRVDAIVQLMEEDDKTYLYIINDSAPMIVKERMEEIVARIGDAL
jgi:uncharacterized protein YlzI (FlbEa/FlbD family)